MPPLFRSRPRHPRPPARSATKNRTHSYPSVATEPDREPGSDACNRASRLDHLLASVKFGKAAASRRTPKRSGHRVTLERFVIRPGAGSARFAPVFEIYSHR
jgi:hypothetical protein